MSRAALRRHLADLLVEATDGAVGPEQALVDGASLTDLGLDSLGYVRLLDAIEAEYGVELALDDQPPPDTVDGLVDRLVEQGLSPADDPGAVP